MGLVTSDAYPDLHDDDHPLIAGLAKLGITAHPVIWTDPSIDWNAFDAIVIRSPWDYFTRQQEFLEWLAARRAGSVPLMNDGAILDWNFDKRYLEDLAAAGVSLIPTIVVKQGEQPDAVALARERGWDEIVVKPTVSGGAYATHRFRLADAARYRDDIARTLTDRGLLIQPFLPEI